MFFHSKNELYVTDLKSANGIFINGVAQKPFQTTKLYSNDVIGIGCPTAAAATGNNDLYAYKLHSIGPQLLEDGHSVSTLSETTIVNNVNIVNDKSVTDRVDKRKREDTNSNLEVASKIPKLQDENYILEKNYLQEKDKEKNENDIEIVHVSLNNNSSNGKNKNCDKLNANKHMDANMPTSSNWTNNTRTESLMDDELINCQDLRSNMIIGTTKKDIKKGEISLNKSTEKVNANMLQEIDTYTGNNLMYTKDVQNTVNNLFYTKDVQNTVNNLHNFESKNTIKDSRIRVKSDLEFRNCNSKYSRRNSSETNTVNEIEKPNTVDKINQFKNNEEENLLAALPSNFMCNEDGIIKFENELQLTDTDENAILNSSDTSFVPVGSPIKLKKVQQQPKTKFSEDDVINLSDSEDDIFPCSQLFDIGYGMNTTMKDEVKEEQPTEVESERFGLDDVDFVISITDSEDEEDKNWFYRLSRSQTFSENDEIDLKSKNGIKKEDIDINVNTKESIVSEFELIGTNEKLPNELVPRATIDEEKEAENSSLQDIDNLNKVFSPENTLLKQSTSAASDTKKHSKSPKNQSLPPVQKEAKNYIHPLSNTKMETITPTKSKKSVEKKVPQIEPPHLPTSRRRRSVSNKDKQIPEKSDKSVRSGKSGKSEKSEKPSKPRLSAKEKKEQQEKLKLEQYMHAKEQKNRKVLHKWADCLPPSTKKLNTLSKEEKKALADNRKMKLKKIAEENRVSLEGNQEKKRIVSKPKAKVTTKSRNDFLVEETIAASREETATEESKTSSSRSTTANRTSSNAKTIDSTKRKNVSKEIAMDVQHKLTLNDISNLGKIPKKSNNTKITINTVEAETALKDLSLEKRTEKTIKLKDTAVSGKPSLESCKTLEKGPSVPLKSNLKSPVVKPYSKKRVSFSTEIQTVREYEIDESNVLKKLTGKDAPLRREKVNTMNQFLCRILSWKPVWLEEQLYLNQDPPVIQPEELNPTLTHYRSYDEYYNIVSSLLLLEIWHNITNKFQSIEDIHRRPTFMCSIVENSIQTNVEPNNILLTTLMVEVLATKDDVQRQIHPKYGDLVYFEYVQNHENSQKSKDFRKVFAYVTNVYTTVLTPLTHFNRDLQNYVKDAHILLTYTVITKYLDKNILVNRVQRLRAAFYLRPNLRMVQALQFLPKSPLVNLILCPRIEMYKLPTVSDLETLITGDKLNEKQMEAVSKITKAVIQKDTKLCFIQGPPGTGKSKVIVNIVTQILYGNNRYTSNGSSFRMLVCAPSNAAIDDIVLRLLEIRTMIKKQAKIKPFRMVRIGQSQMMHSKVKDISITELAKREIKKTCKSSTVPSDSIESEKLFLQSKINALQCKLNSNNLDNTHKDHVRMKLADMSAKYELLKNRTSWNEANDRSRESIRLQRTAENRILEFADIITCTLSSCYTSQMEYIFGVNKKKISVCIVDEATQSCEAETLIPLMLGIDTLVLVGDHNQLPATVLSTRAKKYGLDQSIFSRVQSAFDLQPNNPIIMLDTQYRMQPDISSWPNKFFYGCKLKNAVERDDKFPFHSYRILNLITNQNHDNSNNEEADFVANIIYCMLNFANLDNWQSCISCGILTPYNNQRAMILTKVNAKISSLPENVKRKIKYIVDTVDRFQGQECDVIILSCVRSQKIGFLSDRQRLCVALTRAKHSLIICGNFNIFMRYPMWNSLIADAKTRKVFFNVNPNANSHEIKSYVIKRVMK
ncbi:helicase sen1 isoform X2 [Bombus pyrosoma]|nr:helicase sen1 isoform X2 [Bombus pyrosoma]